MDEFTRLVCPNTLGYTSSFLKSTRDIWKEIFSSLDVMNEEKRNYHDDDRAEKNIRIYNKYRLPFEFYKSRVLALLWVMGLDDDPKIFESPWLNIESKCDCKEEFKKLKLV